MANIRESQNNERQELQFYKQSMASEGKLLAEK
jgi:hypothetical protein